MAAGFTFTTITRTYMQSHVFFRKYVKDWAADFMSRKANVVNREKATLSLLTGDSIEEALRICHKGSEGHGGMRRTYLTLSRTSDSPTSGC